MATPTPSKAQEFIAKVTGLEGLLADYKAQLDSVNAEMKDMKLKAEAAPKPKDGGDDSEASEYDKLVGQMEKIRGILNDCAKLKPDASDAGGDGGEDGGDGAGEGDGEEGTGEEAEMKDKKKKPSAVVDQLMATATKLKETMTAIKAEKATAKTEEVIKASAAAIARIGLPEAVKTAIDKDDKKAGLKGLTLTSAAFKEQLEKLK